MQIIGKFIVANIQYQDVSVYILYFEERSSWQSMQIESGTSTPLCRQIKHWIEIFLPFIICHQQYHQRTASLSSSSLLLSSVGNSPGCWAYPVSILVLSFSPSLIVGISKAPLVLANILFQKESLLFAYCVTVCKFLNPPNMNHI